MHIASALAVLCLILPTLVHGDDKTVNTPVMTGKLQGQWKLQPEKLGAFEQVLHLGPNFSGQWQASKESLPFSLAWFLEGGELRILHYYTRPGSDPFDWRVKTPIVPYTIDGDKLTLELDGKTTTWQRVVQPPAVQQPQGK